MAGVWLRIVDGRMSDLEPRERARFFTYADRTTRGSRTMLMFGMPLLFLIGALRDFAMFPGTAMPMFQRRALLVALLLAAALLVRRLRDARLRESAWVAYVCVFSSGITMTTLGEPARLSMAHVVAMLMIIIMLPFALHRLVMLAVVAAFALPLFLMLAMLHAPPALWASYSLFGLFGIGIGMAHRRTYLDASLDVFQLRRRLMARLQTDSLTGAMNREGWQTRARRQFEHTRRIGMPVSLAYFDLDHFKSINDRHGHAVGDEILERTGTVMAAHTRQDDAFARLGGEEFAVLLPRAHLAEAIAFADHIRREVEAMPGPVAVTLSAGVAECAPSESFDALVARADVAMLEAKRRGRNRVLRACDPARDPTQDMEAGRAMPAPGKE